MFSCCLEGRDIRKQISKNVESGIKAKNVEAGINVEGGIIAKNVEAGINV